MLPSDAYPQPLQLKGEVIDLEFSLDTDHRCVLSSIYASAHRPQEAKEKQDNSELSQLPYVQTQGPRLLLRPPPLTGTV